MKSIINPPYTMNNVKRTPIFIPENNYHQLKKLYLNVLFFIYKIKHMYSDIFSKFMN